MSLSLPNSLRSKLVAALWWAGCLTLIFGVFFLGLFLVERENFINKFRKDDTNKNWEIFGFAPYWTLSKINNVDWSLLTTFAYFSLPVLANGTIDRSSYEWTVFNGKDLAGFYEQAQKNKVRRVVTLTQMDAGEIETFLSNPNSWETVALESIEVIKNKNLDGVNIDFEYIAANDYLGGQFSKFIGRYAQILDENLDDCYITVSVLASSVRFNKIYDVEQLAKVVDGLFMMAYDFYYPGSSEIGPSAPLYGFDEGRGPFWYDVSTAVSDFLKIAPPDKVIMGVAYYGWTYPAYDPLPKTNKAVGRRTFATTLEKVGQNKILETTPFGGWDDVAKVSWRGYWDLNGWHVLYLEDKRSLSLKYDLAKEQKLAGVGIWALGYDNGDETLWSTLRDKFEDSRLSLGFKSIWTF